MQQARESIRYGRSQASIFNDYFRSLAYSCTRSLVGPPERIGIRRYATDQMSMAQDQMSMAQDLL